MKNYTLCWKIENPHAPRSCRVNPPKPSAGVHSELQIMVGVLLGSSGGVARALGFAEGAVDVSPAPLFLGVLP